MCLFLFTGLRILFGFCAENLKKYSIRLGGGGKKTPVRLRDTLGIFYFKGK